MKRIIYYFLSMLAVLFFGTPVFSGTLDPPSSKDTYETYTLEDIGKRLMDGSSGTMSLFSDPANANPTGYTVDYIMGKAPQTDDINGANPADVLSGKTFWGLKSGDGWGTLTGTMAGASTSSGDDSTSDFKAGYYPAFNLATIDSDLMADKIKAGVTIFGVEGTYVNVKAPASVAATGQVACYEPMKDITGQGDASCDKEVPPAKDQGGTKITRGQDGHLQEGMAWPNPRFVDNLDGTVTDKLTWLVWLKDMTCLGKKNWYDAIEFANALAAGECGLNDESKAGDWHLPNIKELQSLVSFGNWSPAFLAPNLDSVPFANIDFRIAFWSSTRFIKERDQDPEMAWLQNLNIGSTLTDLMSEIRLFWPVKRQMPQ